MKRCPPSTVVKRLKRFRPSKDEWETEHERWLREAVFRADGVGGLERIARKTKRPRACLAWVEFDEGDGSKNRCRLERKSWIRQVLISRTLTVCGEVAEWPKAAVC